MEGDNADQPQSPPEFEKVPESDDNISTDADLKVDQSNQEIHLHPEGIQGVIPNVPSYGFGFMQAAASHLAQFDGPEAWAHDVSRLTNVAVSTCFFLVTIIFFLFNWLQYSTVILKILNSLASPQAAHIVLSKNCFRLLVLGICIICIFFSFYCFYS